MNVRVLFFGPTHDLTGMSEKRLEIPEGGCLSDLWTDCVARFPRLAEMAGFLVIAVNQQVAEASHPLRDGDEVAFLPPVSGGAGADFYRVTRQPIHAAELRGELLAPQDGALVVFEGVVRNHSHGRRTLYLEYEAYEPMAVGKMEEIGRELKAQFPVDAVGMVHRVGRLEIGETSVAILVSAAHRQAAFQACQTAINRLKQTVPIWKKEFFADGAVWAEGEGKKSEVSSQEPETKSAGVSTPVPGGSDF
jgi:MoaE-MoaD fusion protein